MNCSIDSPEEFNKLSESEKHSLLNWCSEIPMIKSINYNRSSYGIKHMFERSKNGFYITNGAFKGAMTECNFDCKPVSSTSNNWRFNVSERYIKQLV